MTQTAGSCWMSAEKKGHISRPISISTPALLAAWLLVLVLPVIGSLLALDFFLAEYSIFAEPEKMAIARQDIDECRDLLVIENYLASKLPELENLNLPPESQNIEKLQAAIDAKISGKGLLYVFFDNQSGRLTPCKFSPPDLKRQMPPPALFRKVIQNLAAENYLTIGNRDSGRIQRKAAQCPADSTDVQNPYLCQHTARAGCQKPFGRFWR